MDNRYRRESMETSFKEESEEGEGVGLYDIS